MNELDKDLRRLMAGKLTMGEQIGNLVRGFLGLRSLTREERFRRRVERWFNSGNPVNIDINPEEIISTGENDE